MVVVTVELWPGGSPRKKKMLGTMTIANESMLADVSQYSVFRDGHEYDWVEHTRTHSVWTLVKKALNSRKQYRVQTRKPSLASGVAQATALSDRVYEPLPSDREILGDLLEPIQPRG